MNVWHFYDLATGCFSGRTFAGPERMLAANTPPGCGAIAGVADWIAQRVNVETGQVEDWQPPAPAADEWRTWAWSSERRRWVEQPTVAALWRDVRAERDRRMAAFEWRYSRHAREQRRGGKTRDSIAELDAYMQALADITLQPDPRAIRWPEEPPF